MAVSSVPPLGEALRQLRTKCGWSQTDLARMIETVSEKRDHTQAVVTERTIRRWETAQVQPNRRYRELLDYLFQRYNIASPLEGVDDLAENQADGEIADALLASLNHSDLDDVVVQAIADEVDELCHRYMFEPVEETLSRARASFARAAYLQRTKSLRPGQSSQLLRSIGWLMTLISCLYNDQGEQRESMAWRQRSEDLGRATGDHEITAWSFEILSWYAVNSGRPDRAVQYANAGQELVRSSPVLPQLILKAANGHAQSGRHVDAARSIDLCREVVDEMHLPDDPVHHFAVDRFRLAFFTMECYRWLGDDDTVLALGADVLHRLGQFHEDGRPIPPSFRTETLLTMSVVLARRGEVDSSLGYLRRALSGGGRQTIPSLNVCVNEITTELRRRRLQAHVVDQFDEIVRTVVTQTRT